jgi:hypothetical protein
MEFFGEILAIIFALLVSHHIIRAHQKRVVARMNYTCFLILKTIEQQTARCTNPESVREILRENGIIAPINLIQHRLDEFVKAKMIENVHGTYRVTTTGLRALYIESSKGHLSA